MTNIFDTPFKLTHEEILLSSAMTIFLSQLAQSGVAERELALLCLDPQYGYTAPASKETTDTRFLRITDIKAGSVEWANVPFCDCPNPEKYELFPDDILIARSGSVGKSFLVTSVPGVTVFASYMIRIRLMPSAQCLPEYLYWCLQSQQFWQQVMASRRGSAMKNINAEMLKSLGFPIPDIAIQKSIINFLKTFSRRLEGEKVDLPYLLPPLAEQRRIVGRIEALAGKVEEARRLRAAAAGETKALFGSQLDKEFNQLKQEYGTVPVGSVISFRNDLIRPADGKAGSLRFIGLQHVESHTGRKLGEDRLEAEKLTGRKFLFAPGEIVYGYLRPYLNKVWIADCEGVCSVDQYVIRPNSKKINRDYLAFFMRSPAFLRHAIELTHNLMLPRLRTALLESIPVPLPPLSVQESHVLSFKELQIKTEALRQHQSKVQQELNALLPAILDKAFKGEL